MYKLNNGRFRLVTRLADDYDYDTHYSESLSISGNGSTGNHTAAIFTQSWRQILDPEPQWHP
jgi:hypothetical protein